MDDEGGEEEGEEDEGEMLRATVGGVSGRRLVGVLELRRTVEDGGDTPRKDTGEVPLLAVFAAMPLGLHKEGGAAPP